jgi:hypothetical protein
MVRMARTPATWTKMPSLWSNRLAFAIMGNGKQSKECHCCWFVQIWLDLTCICKNEAYLPVDCEHFHADSRSPVSTTSHGIDNPSGK